MSEYAVFCRMKGLDWYFTLSTLKEISQTNFLDENGRILKTIQYTNGDMKNRVRKWLSLYTDADVFGLFGETADADGSALSGRIMMDDNIVAEMAKKYEGIIRFIEAAEILSIKNEGHAYIPKELESREKYPEYEEV